MISNISQRIDNSKTSGLFSNQVFSYVIISLLFIMSINVVSAADPGHSAGVVGPGAFERGNYSFPGALNITGNLVVGNLSNAFAAFNINSSSAFGSIRVVNGSGSEHFFVNGTTGNVGIGTTAPTSPLHVIGNTYISGSLGVGGSSGNTFVSLSHGSQYYVQVQNGLFHIRDNSAGRNVITINGSTDYVGLGTVNPASALHVAFGNVTVAGWINNVSSPLVSTDAANKAYVDSVTGGAGNSTDTYVPYVGASKSVNLGANNLSVALGTILATGTNQGYKINGTINGIAIFPSESSTYGNAPILGVASASGNYFTIRNRPFSRDYGSVGVVGAAANAGGGRGSIGVYGYSLFNETGTNSNSNDVAGLYGLAEVGNYTTDFRGSVYGVYAKGNSQQSNGTNASTVYGIYAEAAGRTNDTTYAGYFTAAQAGTGTRPVFGVYSAAGLNYFAGATNFSNYITANSTHLGIGGTNPWLLSKIGNDFAITQTDTGARNIILNTTRPDLAANGGLYASASTFQVVGGSGNDGSNLGRTLLYQSRGVGDDELALVSQTAGAVSIWANPQSGNITQFTGSQAQPTSSGIALGRGLTAPSVYSTHSTGRLTTIGTLNLSNVIYTTSGGNVGIGHFNPGALLQLGTGNVTLSGGYITNVSNPLVASDVATKAYVDALNASASATSYWNVSAGNLFPKDLSYNVGIGTTSAPSLLTLSSGSPIIRFVESDSGAGNYTTYVNAGIHVVSFDTATSTYGLVNNQGNIGIGTVAPEQALHIKAAYGRLKLESTNAGTSNWSLNPDSSPAGFHINENSATRFTIANSGNVGVNTSAPGVKFDVSGSHVGGLGIARFKSTDSAFVVIDSATGDGGIRIKNNSADAWLIGVRDGYGLRFNNASDSNVATILQNGNFGLGTTTPTERLSVAPNTDANATIGRAYIGYANTPSWQDNAIFSHYDFASNTGYSFAAMSTGATRINAASGQTISFWLAGNTQAATLSSTGLNVASNITIGGWVTNLSNPLAAQDAATKAYVDAATGGAGSAVWSRSSGNVYLNTTSDNVSIGAITSPNYRLQVLGSVNLSNSIFANSSSGFVGINTSSPKALFEVAGQSLSVIAGTVSIDRPATNIFTNPDFTNGETGWSFSSWDSGNYAHFVVDLNTTASGLTGFTKALRINRTAPSGSADFHQGDIYSQSTPYAVGVWVRGDGTFDITSHWGTLRTVTLTDNWQYVSSNTTSSSTNGQYLYFRASGITNFMEITGVMVEQATSVSTFTDTNRSSGDIVLNGVIKSLGTQKSYFKGSIGINTTNPGYQLEINGATKALNVSNNLFANATNVGIGTSNPEDRLTVNIGTATGRYINLNTGASTQDVAFGLDNSRDPGRIDFTISTEYGAGAWSEKFRLTNQGLVGIGTVYPNSTLHVVGNVSFNNNFFVSSAGNVGIGTTTPSRALDVRGIGNFSGTVYINNGTDVAALVAGADDWNVSGSSLFPLSLGYNVGIGTASPAAKLTLAGSMSTGLETGLLLNNTAGKSWLIHSGVQGSSHDTFAISDITDRGTTTPYFVITNNSNVGIGPQSPADKLHLYTGPSASYGTSGGITISDTNTAVRLWDSGGGADIGTLDLYSGGVQTVKIIANSSSSYINSGNFGLGTTNPQYKLEVNGTIAPSIGGSYDLGASNKVWANVYTRTLTGDTNIAITPVGNTYFTTGNVGIGTTAPAYKLDVNGTSRVTGEASFSNYIRGTATGAGRLDLDSGGTTDTITLGFTDTSTLFTLKDSGNVGIGTTTPSRALDVRGVGNFSGTVYINNGTDISTLVSGSDDWNVSGSDLFPKSVGYIVGVGTTDPAYSLDVNGTGGQSADFAGYSGDASGIFPNGMSPQLRIKRPFNYSVNGATYRGGMIFGEGGVGIYSVNPNPGGSPYYGDLRFFTTYWNGSDYRVADRVTITQDTGYVGINTSSPTSALTIGSVAGSFIKAGITTNDWGAQYAFGVAPGNGILVSKNGTTNDANRVITLFRHATEGGQLVGYNNTGTSTSVGFQISAGGNSYLNGGNVGINSSSPKSALEVNGRLNVSNYLFANATNVGIGTANPTAALDIPASYPGGVSGRNEWARLGRIVAGAVYNGYGVIGEGFDIDGSTYKYSFSDTAAKIDFTSGDIKFSGAAAGTSGNTITWTDSLTLKKGGNISANNNYITGVANPLAAQDAATKAYVDALNASAGTSDDWNLSGSNLFPKSLAYNVGLGLNNPGSNKLAVNSTIYIGSGGFTNNSLTIEGAQNDYVTLEGRGTGTDGGSFYLYSRDNGDEPLYFGRDVYSTAASPDFIDIAITSAGVGINTTSPGADLDIKYRGQYTSIDASKAFRIYNSDSSAANLILGVSGSAGIVQSRDSTSPFTLALNPYSGKVSVNTTAPGSHTFTVLGTSNFTGDVVSGGSFTASANLTASGGGVILQNAGTPNLRLDKLGTIQYNVYNDGTLKFTSASGAGTYVFDNNVSVGGRVTGLSNPLAAQDAATKAYVDALNASSSTGDDWNLTGTNLYPKSLGYNVGIGTITPQARLQVVGSDLSTGANLYAVWSPDGNSLQRNWAINDNSTGWSIGTATVQYVPDGPISSYVVRAPASTQVHVTGAHWIPIDQNKTYRVSVWARSGGAGTPDLNYLSIRTANASFGYPEGNGGWGQPYFYTGAFTTTWARYETTIGKNGQYRFDSFERYFQPGVILNYNSAAGYSEFQGFRIEEMPDTLDTIRTNSYFGADVQINKTSPVFTLKNPTGTSYGLIDIDTNSAGSTTRLGMESNAGGALFTGSSAYASVLGSRGANPLQFATSGVVRATFDSNGNLGLNTTSPSAKLHVAGTTIFGADSVDYNHTFYVGPGGMFRITRHNGENIDFQTTPSVISILANQGDKEFYIGNTNVANGLSLLTNGTIRMTISATGNISAVNNYITNVANPLAAQDAATKAYVDALNASSSTGDDWNLSGSNLFTKDLNYNVSLGIASTIAKLYVNGTIIGRGASDNPALLQLNEYRGGSLVDISESGDAAVATFGYYGLTGPRVSINGGVSNGAGAVSVYNTTGHVYAHLVGSGSSYTYGNLGIGTNSPQAKLEVTGDASHGIRLVVNTTTTNLRLFNNGLGLGQTNALGIDFTATSGFGPALSAITGGWETSTARGTLALRTSGDSGSTLPERLVILGSGNVGINTTTPSALLDVEGGKILTRSTDSNWGQLQVANPGDSEATIAIAASGTGRPGIDSTYTRQWIVGISPYGSGTDKFSITNKYLGANTALSIVETTGNIGINTTSPGAKLHIDGNVSVGNRLAMTPSYFGYNSAWKALVIGSPGTTYTTDAVTLSFGYDPKNNPSGSYTGSGFELLFRNSTYFLQPNATDNGYFSTLQMIDGKVGIRTATTPGAILDVNGNATFRGNVSLNSNYITGLANPVVSSDAATKAYVDAATGGAGSTVWSRLSAGYVYLNTSADNVSIGLPTSSKFKLSVGGDVAIVNSSLYGAANVQPTTGVGSGLLVYYNFDQNLRDSLGNYDATATGTGTPLYVNGSFGYAVNTSSSRTVFAPGSGIDIGDQWTISTWFQAPLINTGSWRTLTRGVNGDHQVIVQSDGILGSYNNSGGNFQYTNFDMDTLNSGWHHLAAVGNVSGYTNFYIDGRFVGNVSFRSTTEITSIGNEQGGSHSQPWGVFDEFRVHNRALSEQEIRALYGQNLWGKNGENIHTVTTGNVGINNTAPTSTLEVKGTFNASTTNGGAALTSTGDFRIGI